MPHLRTLLRLSLLAVATSLTLTSCFDHDHKCDPRPSGGCSGHSTPTTTTTTPTSSTTTSTTAP